MRFHSETDTLNIYLFFVFNSVSNWHVICYIITKRLIKMEIANVLYSDLFQEGKIGAWKKQLNQLSNNTFEIEVYYFPYIHEMTKPTTYDKTFKTELEALNIYEAITSTQKAKKLLTN